MRAGLQQYEREDGGMLVEHVDGVCDTESHVRRSTVLTQRFVILLQRCVELNLVDQMGLPPEYQERSLQRIGICDRQA